MGERRSEQKGKMPSQMQGHGPSAANTRPPASTATDAEDQYYMTRMREILSGFPNTGPPSYPVQILDHVYMGNQRNADNIELLRRYGISHVLNCAGGRQRGGGSGSGTYPKESGIKEVLLIAADDSEDFDIAGRFEEAIEFLDRVRRAKGKALVHCNLGVNRSGALVAAYLLAEQKRTLLEVVNYLKVKRFVVLSNKGFRRQLIQFARSRGRLDPIIRSAETTDSSTNDGGHHHEIQNRSRLEEGRRKGGGGGGIKGDKGAVGCTIERVVINRDKNRGEENIDDVKAAKSDEGALEVSRGHGAVRLPKTGDPPPPFPPTEEPSLRERLWTLPRYTGRGERDKPKPASPPPPTVEVFVSHHGGGGGGEGGGSSGVRLSSASSVADDIKTSTPVTETTDSRSGTKTTGRQQLEPVYETKSYDDAISTSTGSRNASKIAATGSGTTATTTATGSGSGGGGRMSAAAESVSAKLTGFLGSLLSGGGGGGGGPKRQPLRSTSYSNVSSGGSSSSSSRSLASLPPPLAAEERTTSVSSGSLQTSASGTSLSTTRPLRIYTRSSTDTEIYRTRQDTTRQAAGRSGLGLGLLLRRPDPKS